MADNVVVKIDKKLLDRVKALVEKSNYRYTNKKHFVNVAVTKLLEKEE